MGITMEDLWRGKPRTVWGQRSAAAPLTAEELRESASHVAWYVTQGRLCIAGWLAMRPLPRWWMDDFRNVPGVTLLNDLPPDMAHDLYLAGRTLALPAPADV